MFLEQNSGTNRNAGVKAFHGSKLDAPAELPRQRSHAYTRAGSEQAQGTQGTAPKTPHEQEAVLQTLNHSKPSGLCAEGQDAHERRWGPVCAHLWFIGAEVGLVNSDHLGGHPPQSP